MAELELVGLDADGEHLLLADTAGTRHRLLVDEPLRAAVRRDRPRLESLRADATPLRPKEIQEQIRAGATAEDVAAGSGMPVEHVRRYEGPVLAERAWVAERAQRLGVGRGLDSPALGDLVMDRLATRQVDVATLEWDAVRGRDRTWEVVVCFIAGDRERFARWHVDLQAGSARALDDEARWLSETDVVSGTVARRHLSPVRIYNVESEGDVSPAVAAVDAEVSSRHETASERAARELFPAVSAESSASTADEAHSTDDLLAELRASRGIRQQVDMEDLDEEPSGTAPLWDLPPAAHPPASRPEEATDARVLPWPTSAVERTDEEPAEAAPRRRPKNWRASVPSWDEIVFGARPE